MYKNYEKILKIRKNIFYFIIIYFNFSIVQSTFNQNLNQKIDSNSLINFTKDISLEALHYYITKEKFSSNEIEDCFKYELRNCCEEDEFKKNDFIKTKLIILNDKLKTFNPNARYKINILADLGKYDFDRYGYTIKISSLVEGAWNYYHMGYDALCFNINFKDNINFEDKLIFFKSMNVNDAKSILQKINDNNRNRIIDATVLFSIKEVSNNSGKYTLNCLIRKIIFSQNNVYLFEIDNDIKNTNLKDDKILPQKQMSKPINIGAVPNFKEDTSIYDTSLLINKPVEIGFNSKNDTSSFDPSLFNTNFDFTDVEPSFPGGTEKLYEYLGKRINYPEYERDNDIGGIVYIQFEVDKDGKIKDVQVVRSVSKNIDDEAIRVIKSMPKWVSGMKNGRPVRVKYVLPIKFSKIKNFNKNLSDSVKANGKNFSFNDRKPITLPKPKYNSNEQGTVVVKVIIDKLGNTILAESGAPGTTTTNQKLWREAETAAKKSKWTANPDAPEKQEGTIKYIFNRR